MCHSGSGGVRRGGAATPPILPPSSPRGVGGWGGVGGGTHLLSMPDSGRRARGAAAGLVGDNEGARASKSSQNINPGCAKYITPESLKSTSKIPKRCRSRILARKIKNPQSIQLGRDPQNPNRHRQAQSGGGAGGIGKSSER